MGRKPPVNGQPLSLEITMVRGNDEKKKKVRPTLKSKHTGGRAEKLKKERECNRKCRPHREQGSSLILLLHLKTFGSEA